MLQEHRPWGQVRKRAHFLTNEFAMKVILFCLLFGLALCSEDSGLSVLNKSFFRSATRIMHTIGPLRHITFGGEESHQGGCNLPLLQALQASIEDPLNDQIADAAFGLSGPGLHDYIFRDTFQYFNSVFYRCFLDHIKRDEKVYIPFSTHQNKRIFPPIMHPRSLSVLEQLQECAATVLLLHPNQSAYMLFEVMLGEGLDASNIPETFSFEDSVHFSHIYSDAKVLDGFIFVLYANDYYRQSWEALNSNQPFVCPPVDMSLVPNPPESVLASADLVPLIKILPDEIKQAMIGVDESKISEPFNLNLITALRSPGIYNSSRCRFHFS